MLMSWFLNYRSREFIFFNKKSKICTILMLSFMYTRWRIINHIFVVHCSVNRTMHYREYFFFNRTVLCSVFKFLGENVSYLFLYMEWFKTQRKSLFSFPKPVLLVSVQCTVHMELVLIKKKKIFSLNFFFLLRA